MGYTHLSQDERYQIQWLHRGGLSSHLIGRELGRAHSTILRELARNAGADRSYEHRTAHRRLVQRPAIVAARRRVGDWEGDTVVGQGGPARVLTLVERKTGFVRLRRLSNGTARAVSRAVAHALIDTMLGARSYFADPYAAWQRGSNENVNGLLCQYLPRAAISAP
ncbi:IS30 family transposase [Mizugakiibacter sediminis]|nr:IS30 family transposase [Mizugakiibacter sediminis]